MLARQRQRVLIFAFVMFLASIALASYASGRPTRVLAACHARGGYVMDRTCNDRPTRFTPPASLGRCSTLNKNGSLGPLREHFRRGGG